MRFARRWTTWATNPGPRLASRRQYDLKRDASVWTTPTTAIVSEPKEPKESSFRDCHLSVRMSCRSVSAAPEKAGSTAMVTRGYSRERRSASPDASETQFGAEPYRGRHDTVLQGLAQSHGAEQAQQWALEGMPVGGAVGGLAGAVYERHFDTGAQTMAEMSGNLLGAIDEYIEDVVERYVGDDTEGYPGDN